MTTASEARREALKPYRSSSVQTIKVRLRVWGFAPADVARAEQVARDLPRAAFWEIAEVIPTMGGTCPIPSGDTIALDQGSDYDCAWAAYLASPHAD